MTERDLRIESLKKEIESKRNRAVELGVTPSLRTNCCINIHKDARYNLRTLQENDLRLMLAWLTSMSRGASTVSTISDDPVIFCGFTFEEWIFDTQVLLNQKRSKKELANLEKMEAQLNELLSCDAKADKAVQDIERMLKG